MGNSVPDSLFSTDESPQAALLDRSVTQTPAFSSGVDWRSQFPEIVGRSPKMSSVLETVSKVANSNSPVLILGESGTGKELIASAIHRLSPRGSHKFIEINCSAIPEDLLESELFGHEKGAFTGADKKRIGKFEAARGGTIFLDEIGDMSPRLQAKLLRVLQEMSLTPVGSNEKRKIDVRVISATNINLPQAIKEGKFRLDLFYRLNVLPIDLPALKDRENDAVLILEQFLERQNREHKFAEPCWLAPDTLRLLSNYSWPGNVRQLQNVVERLVVLKGGGRIGLEDLPAEIQAFAKVEPANHMPPGMMREQPTHAADAGVAPYGQCELPQTGFSRPISNVSHDPKKMTYPAGFGEVPQFASLPEAGIDLAAFVEKIENGLIIQALDRTGNNKQRAAKLLGLNRTTLVERIKKRKILSLNAPSKEL